MSRNQSIAITNQRQASTDCESGDELDCTSLQNALTGSNTDNAYSLLGKTIGCSPSPLSSYAKIRRLKPGTPVYDDIDLYVRNGQCPTHNFTMTVVRIYKIKRFNEKYHSRGEYRMMLWHGTKKARVQSILQQGFCPPKTNNGSNMYGAGVYFADRASKSANYCESRNPGSTGIMFLCDVNLGRVYKAGKAHNEYSAPPTNFDTVKGNGKYHPKWRSNVKYHGSIMPLGETVENTRFTSYPVQYNEYIVYDASRVTMNFIVEVKFS